MATQARSPSCFNFLKEALLLPTRNLKLFTPIFIIFAVFLSLLLVGNHLAIRPLTVDITLHVKRLQTTDPKSTEYAELLEAIQKETKELMIVCAFYFLASVIITSIIRIITIYATAATYSGERPTLRELLCKVRATAKGPVVTLAFVYVLEFVYAFLITALAVLLVFLAKISMLWVSLDLLLLLLSFLFFLYFAMVCDVSMVVSVVETSCYGMGAVRRAWRLMEGKKMQAFLCIVVVLILPMAIFPLYTFATKYALKSMACGLLLGCVYVLLLVVVQLFCIGAVTVYYYECKQSKEQAVAYTKLSSDDAHV